MHPDEIGPYRITKKIGSGGMGNVYHGVHQETGQEVAVKVLPASMTREGGFVRRFSREIEAMRQLDNPYIVSLFEDGQAEDGSYFYSMEFVDGETLTSLISRRRKLPWDEVIDLASQIATALKAAHDAGIIHRDLKPSNLMVGSSGKLKLTDFGVADIFAGTRLTRPGGVVGTAEYMSPEQARGKRATKHSDLYSLGAVMYVMIAGRPPFTGKQASEIMHQHQVAMFDKPSHYAPSTPRLLEELVCRLLEKKPDDRLPDALVVLRQLENIKGRIEFEQRTGEQTRVLSDANTSAGQTVADRQTDERGPATLVRDVMRNDIAESRRKSPVAAFFDNTLVLVAMLAGLIFLAFYLSRRSEVSPAEQFSEAKAMMGDKPGPKWVRARNDFLVPLLKSEALPDDQAEIQHLIQQVEDYEFCRSFKTRGSGGTGQSELHRLIQRAVQKHSNGDGSEAVRQMKAIQSLLAENSRHAYLATFVDETLALWDDMVAHKDRQEYFRATLDEIRKQMSDGNEAVAADRLNALKILYASESSVEKELEQTTQLLQSLAEKQQP